MLVLMAEQRRLHFQNMRHFRDETKHHCFYSRFFSVFFVHYLCFGFSKKKDIKKRQETGFEGKKQLEKRFSPETKKKD